MPVDTERRAAAFEAMRDGDAEIDAAFDDLKRANRVLADRFGMTPAEMIASIALAMCVSESRLGGAPARED